MAENSSYLIDGNNSLTSVLIEFRAHRVSPSFQNPQNKVKVDPCQLYA